MVTASLIITNCMVVEAATAEAAMALAAILVASDRQLNGQVSKRRPMAKKRRLR